MPPSLTFTLAGKSFSASYYSRFLLAGQGPQHPIPQIPVEPGEPATPPRRAPDPHEDRLPWPDSDRTEVALPAAGAADLDGEPDQATPPSTNSSSFTTTALMSFAPVGS